MEQQKYEGRWAVVQPYISGTTGQRGTTATSTATEGLQKDPYIGEQDHSAEAVLPPTSKR